RTALRIEEPQLEDTIENLLVVGRKPIDDDGGRAHGPSLGLRVVSDRSDSGVEQRSVLFVELPSLLPTTPVLPRQLLEGLNDPIFPATTTARSRISADVGKLSPVIEYGISCSMPAAGGHRASSRIRGRRSGSGIPSPNPWTAAWTTPG